jgi:hypothetical protein
LTVGAGEIRGGYEVMMPFNRFFHEKFNGPKGKAFPNLKGKSTFHVFRVGSEYFLLTNNKAGELYKITRKTCLKTHLDTSG